MTLREAIDKGIVSLDEKVDWQWWDDEGEPSIEEPEEWADGESLPLGDEFEFYEGLAMLKRRRYRVTAIPDPETGEGEYQTERIA